MKSSAHFKMFWLAALSLASLGALGVAQEAPVDGSPTPVKVVENVQQANEMLAETKSELESIPEATDATSLDARRKAAFERRVALLNEYVQLQSKKEGRANQLANSNSRLKQAQEQLAQLANAPEAQPPSAPTTEGFQELSDKISQQRASMEPLQSQLGESSQRADGLPTLVSDAQSRASDAQERAAQFAQDAVSATDTGEKNLLEFRSTNANLENQIALSTISNLQENVKQDKDLEPVVTAELDLATKQLQRLEAEYALYAKAIEQELSDTRDQMAQDLAKKQGEATSAETPADRFVAQYEAEVAQSKINASDLEVFSIRVQKDQVEQEKRLASEKTELDNLKEYFDLPGLAAQAADRIRQLRGILALRREMLNRSLQSGLAENLNTYRSRRFEIEESLFDINNNWDNELAGVLKTVPENEKNTFKDHANDVLTEYRNALRDEKTLLTDVITLGQQVQNLTLARLDNLNVSERFIRSKAFTLRDAPPLTWQIVEPAMEELHKLPSWASDLASSDSRNSLRQLIRGPLTIALGVLLFPVLPLFLIYVRHKVRQYVRRRHDRLEDRTGLAYSILTILYSVFAASLLPSYLFLAGWIFNSITLPASGGPILAEVCTYTGYFLFLWLVARSMFSGRSIAHLHFAMPIQAGNALYRSIRMAVFGCGTLLTVTWVLEQAPFAFQSLPRLTYLLFELIAGFTVVRVLRPRSAFVVYLLDSRTNPHLRRYWPMLKACVLLLGLSIIVLDVLGYRYASHSLAVSFGLSLLVLLVLPPVYMLTSSVVTLLRERNAKRKRDEGPETEDETEFPAIDPKRMERFLRVLFLLVGILLIARVWGLDAQAFQNLDEMSVYTIRSTGEIEEFVSAGDILRSIFYVLSTVVILRNLPGIYEFAIFPRIKLDVGAKYAVLTISRYGIFAVGLFFALSALHLDFAKLSWLIAAVGVGLGFGLQEIVSNFVSGIILLIERPIQVGDVITVGDMAGTVRRINIRATTILNFDRQEVVVPNRELITNKVTNWTRGDTINRLAVNIGVAYGSDVDLVSSILEQIAKDDRDVLDDPPPIVTFAEHGESSLDFVLRVFIPEPGVRLSVCDRLNKAINREFARHEIEIPFPQRDVHIRTGGTKLDDAPDAGAGD